MDDKTKELIRLLGTKEGKALLNKASVTLSLNDFAPATGLSTPLKPRRPTNLEGIQASAVKQHNSTVAGLPRGIKHVEPEDVSLPKSPDVEVSRLLINGIEVNFQDQEIAEADVCLLYTSPSPRDGLLSRMPSSA